MAENFTYLREDTVNLYRKFNRLQGGQTQRNPYEKYYNQTIKSQIQKENQESSKKEVTHSVQGTFSNINSQFLIRNYGGQKAVECYVESADPLRSQI